DLVSPVGAPLDRLDGPQKVAGTATYAFEYAFDRLAYAFVVQSTIAKGRIVAIDDAAAQALPGVLAVLTHANAPALDPGIDGKLKVLQSDRVAFRGQVVALALAETLEIAREAAACVRVTYAEETHDVVLSRERGDLVQPKVLANFSPPDTGKGDVERAMASAPVTIDVTYRTPHEHNMPLEPHAAVAIWNGDGLTLYDTNQGPHGVRDAVVKAFGLPPERVRVIAPYVGGGFGSKGGTRPHVILAAMAARQVERPVKLAFTRQQMFALTGYRTPTIQRVQLGAGLDGRLVAIAHDVVEQTGADEDFAEPTGVAARVMYAAPNRRTSHRVTRLDLPSPSYMRAPGEAPGMFGLECAMDELAIRLGLDPVELRVRNEPAVDPEDGRPFSSRNLVACLREGARRFGWDARDPRPGARREGRWLIGTGMAAATYPARRMPSSARVRREPDGRFRVAIGASDIGTGTWTSLTQIAAEALDVPVERVVLEIGDTAYPKAMIGVGSMGLSSWGSAVVEACRKLREEGGDEARADSAPGEERERYSMHAFGAQFAEVRVDVDTGEVRVPRLCGVFACGRIVNAKTARSQMLGGITWGVGMALHEISVLDPRFGDFVNHDLAEYHVATNADTGEIDVAWVDEHDPHVNPVGIKGIGEIGIVGVAAAIANAVHHATGIRVRELPITPDVMVRALAG
ncbi:MAG TPA: xanthine dehydrogenase family protein molybdopterin-binding subunit, partial [Candidatus Elarobacter sp.]|nr:xanthine dehydrogenase family protein molybdopterin-binding subunit [Candidatus Elarobacter sp.]